MLDTVTKLLADKAPLILQALQGPVDATLLLQLEASIGAVLPDDFKQLYRCNNGFSPKAFANLFYGFPLFAIETILGRQADLDTTGDGGPLRYADPGIKNDYTFGLKRIPIGDDSATCLLCVDMDPAEGGTVGQVILIDYEMGVGLMLNTSVTELVAQFAQDLQENKYSLLAEALEDGVHWLQPIREIEPGNWFNSPRWQYVNQALKTK